MVSEDRYNHVTARRMKAGVYKQSINNKQTSDVGGACFRKQMFDCLN
jgi:hypothetical protein